MSYLNYEFESFFYLGSILELGCDVDVEDFPKKNVANGQTEEKRRRCIIIYSRSWTGMKFVKQNNRVSLIAYSLDNAYLVPGDQIC